MTDFRPAAKIDYRRRMGWLESILVATPALLLLWALASGYGPLLGIGLVLLLVVVTTLRFAFALWQLWRP
jgi:hypothetical protein